MKVRIGYGPAGAGLGERDLPEICTSLEQLGFDSLWLPERLTAALPDPLVALSVAAGLTKKVKLGTSVLVLPGRNPVVLAKQLATLDRLSGARLLPAVGLGVADSAEQEAFGVERAERAGWVDEALPLLRKLWSGVPVDHTGRRFRCRGLRLALTPLQDPLDVWLGGTAPSELRRAGRLADGWLPSFCTPAQASSGRSVVEAEADLAGRKIDPEHFGAVLAYSRRPVPAEVAHRISARRPSLDLSEVVAPGLEPLRERVEAFVRNGFSKFVLVPVGPVRSWTDELQDVAVSVLTLQSS